jgi:preprotein translocase subunit YajC
MTLSEVAWIILGQQGGAADVAPQGGSPLMSMLIMFGPLILLFWFLIIRPNQKREQQRRQMLASLKKNDHVVTIGGIKGVVANVKHEEDEVVLRIDDEKGVKIRLALSGIAHIVGQDSNEKK